MVGALISALFVGALSAFLPATPVEPYILGLTLVGDQPVIPLSIAAAAGQTAGKLLIFLGTRTTLRTGWLHRCYAWATRRYARVGVGPASAAVGTEPPDGRWRAAARSVQAAGRRLTALLDRPMLVTPTVFVSAVVGVPPLLAVSVYAARTPITATMFTACCLAGRTLRFLALTSAPFLLPIGQ